MLPATATSELDRGKLFAHSLLAFSSGAPKLRPMSLVEFRAKIETGAALTPEEARSAAGLLADETVADPDKRAFLVALARRGETPEEVAAFAATFREKAKRPPLEEFAGRAIDVCGTGGDHAGSFNISTTVAFVVAAAGVPVIKHGNRSVSSQCGSADLLEELGLQLDASAKLLQESLERINFCFLFAPAFHPAFRAIMPVRKMLGAEGQRTIFNLLGPMINPGQPAHQLMGVFGSEWVAPIADAFGQLGLRRGLVVHCELPDGAALDELSCAGKNQIAGAGNLGDYTFSGPAEEFGLTTCPVADLRGGDVKENLQLLEDLMAGEAPAGLRDSIVLNAGAALWITEKVASLEDGLATAREILEKGQLRDWLRRAQQLYA